jgi:hypothetical protein
MSCDFNGSYLPFLSCDFSRSEGASNDKAISIAYCVCEKVVLLIALLIIMGSLRQIYIYRKDYAATWKNTKIRIFTVCALSQVYVFCHYGIIQPIHRPRSFSFIQGFGFLVFHMICTYFTDHSSGIFRGRKTMMLVL